MSTPWQIKYRLSSHSGFATVLVIYIAWQIIIQYKICAREPSLKKATVCIRILNVIFPLLSITIETSFQQLNRILCKYSNTQFHIRFCPWLVSDIYVYTCTIGIILQHGLTSKTVYNLVMYNIMILFSYSQASRDHPITIMLELVSPLIIDLSRYKNKLLVTNLHSNDR